MTNRALIINSLAQGEPLAMAGPLCDDCDTMRRALASGSDHIDVGAAGTVMRFLTAYMAVQQGRTVIIDGDERMRQRPVGILVDALRSMGASIHYLGHEGYPPLRVTGGKLRGGHIALDGSVSSQFVTALLMIGPVAGGITLSLAGDIVSRPYIDMTLAMMRQRGIEAQWHGNTITVPAGSYSARQAAIEADWSAASYWLALAALLPQSTIALHGLATSSLQGDSAIVNIMKPLAVTTTCHDTTRHMVVTSASTSNATMSATWQCDMSATSDLVPTLAVTLCLLRMPFNITGVASLRIKESDRLAALKSELAKLGYTIRVGENTVSYNGNHHEVAGNVVIDPHNDHRMAMAFSLAATRHSGIAIANPHVVSKSYPQWWEHLAQAGFTILKTNN